MIPYKHSVFTDERSVRLTITTDACEGTANEIRYLEHVQIFITLDASRRGDVTIYLRSPMNTTSMILSRRPNDADRREGFVKWPFMTTHDWAENPRGEWQLEVCIEIGIYLLLFLIQSKTSWQVGFESDEPREGLIHDVTLVLHGMKDEPYGRQEVMHKNSKLYTVKRAHGEGKSFAFAA